VSHVAVCPSRHLAASRTTRSTYCSSRAPPPPVLHHRERTVVLAMLMLERRCGQKRRRADELVHTVRGLSEKNDKLREENDRIMAKIRKLSEGTPATCHNAVETVDRTCEHEESNNSNARPAVPLASPSPLGAGHMLLFLSIVLQVYASLPVYPHLRARMASVVDSFCDCSSTDRSSSALEDKLPESFDNILATWEWMLRTSDKDQLDKIQTSLCPQSREVDMEIKTDGDG